MCEDHRLNRFTAFTESNENSRHIPQRFHVRRTRMICIDHWKMLPSPPVHFLLLLILSHARSLRHRPNRRGSSLCLKTQYDLPSASSEESGGTWLITFGDFLLCCACALVLFRRRPPSGCRRVCSLIGRFSDEPSGGSVLSGIGGGLTLPGCWRGSCCSGWRFDRRSRSVRSPSATFLVKAQTVFIR